MTTAMRLHDITDPDTFERLVQESFVEERLKTTPRKVERMIGITDYEKLFDSKAANKEQQIKYLHTVSKFMLIRDKTGKKVHLYYKHDSTAPGWLPKPVIVTNSYNATLSRLVAKYKGKLFRDKVKKVWEDRVIIGVLWKSEHDQYIVNTDLTTGMDEAEYDIFSVRELII